jgi:hypothetical protein
VTEEFCWTGAFTQSLRGKVKDINLEFNCECLCKLVGFTLSEDTKALRESRGIALLYFFTSALGGGEGSALRPGHTLPPGKTRYPLYRRLGGLQGRSGQVRKISPPPGFDPRTVQPVGSRYTDYATRPTNVYKYIYIYNFELRRVRLAPALRKTNYCASSDVFVIFEDRRRLQQDILLLTDKKVVNNENSKLWQHRTITDSVVAAQNHYAQCSPNTEVQIRRKHLKSFYCCTVHFFDDVKILSPTNALFIRHIKY